MQFITIYWWRIIACALISYLLGSFSFAVIFTKLSSKKDVREMGSGNAGFTNVLRSVGVVPAIFTFVFDCLKGIISVLITMWIFNMDFDSTAINAFSESLRFEFNAYGKYIKENSPYKRNMVVENCNEYCGYIPTQKSFVSNGDLYETSLCRHSCLVPEAGTILSDKALELAKKLGE